MARKRVEPPKADQIVRFGAYICPFIAGGVLIGRVSQELQFQFYGTSISVPEACKVLFSPFPSFSSTRLTDASPPLFSFLYCFITSQRW